MDLGALVDYVIDMRLRNVQIPPEECGCLSEVFSASSKVIGAATAMGFLLALAEKNLESNDGNGTEVPLMDTGAFAPYHVSRIFLLDRKLCTLGGLASWIDTACLALAAADYVKAVDAMLVVAIKIELGAVISEFERRFVKQANSFLSAVAASSDNTATFRNFEWIQLVRQQPSRSIDLLAGSATT